MKLIGHAFLTGRIDFGRELNPWAFQRIDAGMKQSQKDRIHVDPRQAKVELISAPVNGAERPAWMPELEKILRSADSMYLQFKSGVLRFRMASHDAGKDRTFITIGTQEEMDAFADQHWQKIRYFYAERRPGALSCFDFHNLITHRTDSQDATQPMEVNIRLDQHHASGTPQLSIDATGSAAPLEIIEWRGSVKEGEKSRYLPPNKHMIFKVRNMNRPFTMLHEDRKEFKSHSYTFNGSAMEELFKRVVDRRIKEIARLETLEDAG